MRRLKNTTLTLTNGNKLKFIQIVNTSQERWENQHVTCDTCSLGTVTTWSWNMCDSLSERMILILWEPIACELILFPHDSLKKESRERWKQGNREAKRWCRFTAWTGVRGASFFSLQHLKHDLYDGNPVTVNPQQNPTRPNHFHWSGCHF